MVRRPPKGLGLVATLSGMGSANDVAVSGSRAYVATETGMAVVDVAVPGLPRLIDSVSTGLDCRAVTTAGSSVVLACRRNVYVLAGDPLVGAATLTQGLDGVSLAADETHAYARTQRGVPKVTTLPACEAARPVLAESGAPHRTADRQALVATMTLRGCR